MSRADIDQIQYFKLNKSFVTECDQCPEGALTPNLKNAEVTVQNKLHYCRKLSGQNLSMTNQQRAINPKI